MGVITILSDSKSLLLASSTWLLLLSTCVLALMVYFVSHSIYNLYLHPLAAFPGPWYAVISNVFFSRTLVGGKSVKIIRDLHEKYGEVVRLAPDELSFSSAAAWKDIYTQRKSGNQFLKDEKFYITNNTVRAPHLVNMSDPVKHAQAKKIMSHAFSPKSLSEQEDIVRKYADMFMVAIKEESDKGPIDLNDCYNWITFDILGELAFSEPFGSLEARKTHPWVATTLNMVTFVAYNSAIYRISPKLTKSLLYFVPKSVAKGRMNHVLQSKAKILARLDRKTEKKDFSSYIFQVREEMGLTDWELSAYSNSLIIAGSETSATTLSALTHWLCKTPLVYSKLKDEVRSRFESSSEITSQSATFPYLTAVIHETLRIFPPFPFGPPRITPLGGETVAGVFVPEGTTVSVHMWSSTRNPKNFKDPDAFRPERWLDPNSTDDFSGSNPFLLGPRACIGQNMAWMELRILIAKMVFLFDFETFDKETDWGNDVDSLLLWQKPKLMTEVTARNVS
ncbi:Cytochrome P450 monooxygenase hmp1 [Lachnellula suecica]|uniref:Cytochrome P450 monooxygenase hmp1 n=1 Tax=Lachnellula suecica TaxID=602035 RepID=A0A8T9CC12_9HELO|nr:Cytochrome P450 monooxygenase hmp1 [Lachnellula suecica]